MVRKQVIKQPEPSKVSALARGLPCTRITASVLVNRGITTVRQARSFLDSTVADLPSPFSIRDMDTAAGRICKAIENREIIMVFGDYDADGITSTAILVEFLKHAGARVKYYIPHRIMEGYGLKREHIASVAAKEKATLLITVDCGISSHEAAEACRESGIDLVITDHHKTESALPPALAVVNPSRADCPSGLSCLAGVGVTFYLLIALRAMLREKGFWNKIPEPNLKACCDLVAIGTVADIVPLVGANRILVKTGLEMINNRCRPGIEALIETAKLKRPAITSEDVAFRLAPRINAPGRIDHALRALELLRADSREETARLAGLLNRLNTRRQAIEEDIYSEISQVLLDRGHRMKNMRTIVLAHRQWHQGVIGIAASKAARRYCMPVALIAVNGDIGIGSARSIPGLDLYRVLKSCARLLEDFGGHEQAAGFKIKTENIPAFEKQFEYKVNMETGPEDFISSVDVDCELPFSAITPKLLDEITALQPFGTGNPEPIFFADNIRVVSSTMLNNRHRRMSLIQPGGNRPIDAIQFNTPQKQANTGFFRRVLFRLRQNTWNRSGGPRLVIEDVTA